MSKVLTVDEMFEDMWRNTADSENHRDIENYYLDLFNIDIREAAKRLYVASQDYTSTKFSSYSHLLKTVSVLVVDERIYEEFFSAPARAQEIMIKLSHQFLETESLLGFMKIFKLINYPDFDFLMLNFSNLDQIVDQINAVRKDKIDVRLIESKFIRTARIYCNVNRTGKEAVFTSPEIGLTFFLLLGMYTGFNIVQDMLERLHDEKTAPSFLQFLNLAKNWEDIKMYPVEWFLEIA